MRFHSGQNESVLEWLSRRVDFELPINTYLIWTTSDLDGVLLGAMGFGGRMGRTWGSISVALADTQEGRSAAVPLTRAGLCWFFGTQQAKATYATISSKRSNWIHSLVRIVGFVEVDRVEAGVNPHEDLVILKLTPETCRPWKAELAKLQRMQMREAS